MNLHAKKTEVPTMDMHSSSRCRTYKMFKNRTDEHLPIMLDSTCFIKTHEQPVSNVLFDYSFFLKLGSFRKTNVMFCLIIPFT